MSVAGSGRSPRAARVRRGACGLGSAVLGLAIAAVPLLAAPALAQSGESIRGYDVTLDLAASGTLQVSERIRYDFGTAQRHGIFRQIPVRLQWDSTHDRVWEVSDVQVSSDAPADVQSSTDNGVLTLRIGDPDTTVTGLHTYTLRYTVAGATARFTSGDELTWNAVGDQWDVPIQAVSVTVRAPDRITRVACYAGPYQSTQPCAHASSAGRTATFTQQSLDPGEGLTTAVGLPVGAISDPGPVLVERWSLARAFRPAALQVGLAALVLVLGAAGLARLGWTVARDRKYVGTTPGFVPPPGTEAVERPRPWRAPEPPVQFTPPRGMAPGVAGTLLDERADPLDVSATIVDLAVRGYVRITELERAHLFGSRDWLLERTAESDRARRDRLRPYETDLLSALFATGDTVRLSELKTRFHLDMDRAQKALNAECVAQHWFRGDPRQVRGIAMAVGFVAVLAAAGVLFLLARFTTYGLVGVALLLVAAGGLAMSGSMPSRSGTGTAALEQLLGFRRYIATAEVDQLRQEESVDVFSRYLPWAMVFGETDRWARVLGALAAREGVSDLTPYWYAGPAGWNPAYLADSLDGFAAQSAATLSARPASQGSGFSGGGFSGGGGGGGGGGSW